MQLNSADSTTAILNSTQTLGRSNIDLDFAEPPGELYQDPVDLNRQQIH